MSSSTSPPAVAAELNHALAGRSPRCGRPASARAWLSLVCSPRPRWLGRWRYGHLGWAPAAVLRRAGGDAARGCGDHPGAGNQSSSGGARYR